MVYIPKRCENVTTRSIDNVDVDFLLHAKLVHF
jgi:hypothetical protein